MPRRRANAEISPAATGAFVHEQRYANGLRALVVPRPGASIVVSDLFYAAGSIDDPPGKSGLAHLVEHLLFHGTARFPKGQIDLLTYLVGGSVNAETGEDDTHYWFALPRSHWTLALAIEADRIQNARFDPAEFAREHRVVLEERARELDSAAGRLEETHIAFSYLHHPYRNPIFGWLDDLRGLTVEDAQNWYREHFTPDGAVLVVAGDVAVDEAVDQVGRTLGVLPSRGQPTAARVPHVLTQEGRRSFVIERGEGLPRAIFGWHTVPRLHPDAAALEVLADLLTGGAGTRLRERLVNRGGLATWVSASQEGGRLAGQFLVRVEATMHAEPARVEAEIRAVLASLASHGPDPAELERCRKRLDAAWLWEQQDLAGLASGLGATALWHPWRAWIDEHQAALAVTPDDIRRVIRRHLRDVYLTVGWTQTAPATRVVAPAGAAEEAPAVGGSPVYPSAVPALDFAAGLAMVGEAAPNPLAIRPTVSTVANGLRLTADVQPGAGVVALELYCDGGVLREARPGVAYLASRLREELRAEAPGRTLLQRFEDIGGHAEFVTTGVSIRVRSADLAAAIDLIAETIANPRFESAALRRTKARIDDELRGDMTDGLYRAGRVFLKRIYGTHPLGRDARGSRRQLAALTLADVRNHQRAWFTPDRSNLVAVGDFDVDRLKSLLRARLKGWRAAGTPASRIPNPRPRWIAERLHFARPGEMVHLLLGHLGVARLDPDFIPLAILDHILGSGPGFVDRLSRVLRDELGIAYAVGGGMTDSADIVPGVLRVYASTNPADAGRAVGVLRAAIDDLHAGRFSETEVRSARQYLARSSAFDCQNVSTRAERLLEWQRFNLPIEQLPDWPARIVETTAEQVRDAARRRIHPEGLIEVVLGPLAEPVA